MPIADALAIYQTDRLPETRDPGRGHWIDTTGHRSGTALLRWISAESHPVPRCRVVPLDSL